MTTKEALEKTEAWGTVGSAGAKRLKADRKLVLTACSSAWVLSTCMTSLLSGVAYTIVLPSTLGCTAYRRPRTKIVLLLRFSWHQKAGSVTACTCTCYYMLADRGILIGSMWVKMINREPWFVHDCRRHSVSSALTFIHDSPPSGLCRFPVRGRYYRLGIVTRYRDRSPRKLNHLTT